MKENVLNADQIQDILVCGRKLAKVLDIVVKAVKPGITASELNEIAETELEKEGIVPSFKNYYVPGVGNYPSALCVSKNAEIVHGLPTKAKLLFEGDIVSLDIGAGYKGIYTDMAVTLPVGGISKDSERLIRTTEASLYAAIPFAKAGNHLGDIGAAIEAIAKQERLGIVRDYVGHGIGTKPHLWPQIPNYGVAGSGPALTEGMALAIEPMLTLGSEKTSLSPDGWTVLTRDRTAAAHFEHTVVIVDGKPVIVTQ